MVSVAAFVLQVQAQSGSTQSEFAIQGISTQLVNSPNINSDYQRRASGRPGQWLEIEVTFAWNPRDRAQTVLEAYDVRYFVLLRNSSASPDKKDTLLAGTASHVLLFPGRDKKSVMFVSPQQLLKLFGGRIPSSMQQVVAGVGIEIAVSGQVVAEHTNRGQGAWWRDAAATAGFNRDDGILLDKSRTPFAHLVYDYHEPLKQ